MRAAQAWRPGTVRARACLPQQAALSRSFAALRAAPAPCRRDAHNGGARRLRCAAEVATTPQAAAEPLLCGSAALQGKRDDQEDALTVLPYTLAGGYTYAGAAGNRSSHPSHTSDSGVRRPRRRRRVALPAGAHARRAGCGASAGARARGSPRSLLTPLRRRTPRARWAWRPLSPPPFCALTRSCCWR